METNPVKAIRQYCIQCVANQPNEVKLCPITDCPLYAFRFGKNPYRAKREYTEEQKEAMAKRLRERRNNVPTTSEPQGLEDS